MTSASKARACSAAISHTLWPLSLLLTWSSADHNPCLLLQGYPPWLMAFMTTEALHALYLDPTWNLFFLNILLWSFQICSKVGWISQWILIHFPPRFHYNYHGTVLVLSHLSIYQTLYWSSRKCILFTFWKHLRINCSHHCTCPLSSVDIPFTTLVT